MNRIILLGNGFDLAHGLETSYHDFLLSYLKSKFKLVNINSQYSDDLISIEQKYHQPNLKWIETSKTVEDFISQANEIYYSITYKSDFCRAIFSTGETKKWVDIEMLFFNFLKPYIDRKNPIPVITLNKQIDFLKKELALYLKGVYEKYENEGKRMMTYNDLFKNDFYSSKPIREGEIQDYYKAMIVNFNYTETFKFYHGFLDPNLFDFVNIHGNFEDPDNIIFGMGDEIDAHYSLMENLNENEFFKHVKSFQYLKYSDYRRLFSLIENTDEPFEVLIFGHSLGLSDRTMLSQIFNNPNLKRVKIYYHKRPDGTNDYIERIHEISRHFKDKGAMRLKIVPFEESEEMPQYNKVEQ